MNTGRKTAVGVVILLLFGSGSYLWQRSHPVAVLVEPANGPAAPVADVPSGTASASGATVNAAAPVADAGASAADAAAPAADAVAPNAAAVDAASPDVPAPDVQAEAADVAAVPAAIAPSLDLVRIEQDGTALVAGQAPAGSTIALMANAVQVASTTADQAGKFVALFGMPATASGQMLTMEVTLPDGRKIASGSQIAIATFTPAAPPKVEVAAAAEASAAPAAVLPAVSVPTAPSADVTTEAPPAIPAEPPAAAAEPPAVVAEAPAAVAEVPAAVAEVPAAVAEAPAAVAEAPAAVAEVSAAVAEAGVLSAATVEVTPEATAPATPEVPAGAATALALTETGVKVLQSGAAPVSEMVGNVSMDLIAYPSPQKVQFGGHGAMGQFIRLYLDNDPLGQAVPIGPDGAWAVTMDGIAPGIYTLRADQVDGSGKVTSRFETPFQRETPEALAAASGVETPGSKVADAGTADSGKTGAPVVDPAAVTPPEPATEATGATADVSVAPDVAASLAPAVADVATATTEAPTTEAPATEAAATEAAATPAAAPETTAATATAAGQGPAADATVADALPVTEQTAVTAVPAADAAVTAAPEAPTAATVPAADGTVAAQTAPAALTVTVQPGYTLWYIAKQNFGDGVLYVQVFEANKDKIRNPDLIYPGQIFTIPAN